jgi:hypothetical protein
VHHHTLDTLSRVLLEPPVLPGFARQKPGGTATVGVARAAERDGRGGAR